MEILKKDGIEVALLPSTEKIMTMENALDLMATATYYSDSSSIIVYKESLNDSFFDLKTGFAGELLQKFSNYNVRLGIVGDFSMYNSKALNDFIYECNQGKSILWANSLNEALNLITK